MKNVSYQTETAGGSASPQAAAPRFLKMKRLLALLFVLFVGMQWGYAYDFSNTSGGKTFYYNIIDATNRYVEVTYPNTSSNPWGGYTKPTGYWTLLSAVIYQGQTYTVTRIGSYAFKNCTGLTSVSLPNSVTTIGESAFDGCSGLASVNIPTSATSIGQYAFYGTGISSATIPSGVTTLGDYAFKDCNNLTSVTINSNAVASKAYSVTSNYGIYTYNNFRSIFGAQVTSYTFGANVTAIGKYALYGCSNMTQLTFNGNNLTTIGDRAFYGCTGLTSVTLPNSITTIGYRAFSGCTGLTSVTIPSGVTTLGDSAFDGCNNLTSVTINSNAVA